MNETAKTVIEIFLTSIIVVFGLYLISQAFYILSYI